MVEQYMRLEGVRVAQHANIQLNSNKELFSNQCVFGLLVVCQEQSVH